MAAANHPVVQKLSVNMVRPATIAVALTHLSIPVAMTFRDGGMLAGVPFLLLAALGFWAAFDTTPPRGTVGAQVAYWAVLFTWQLVGALTLGGFWLAWWGASFLLCLLGVALTMSSTGLFEEA